jgi:hypothetical protein
MQLKAWAGSSMVVTGSVKQRQEQKEHLDTDTQHLREGHPMVGVQDVGAGVGSGLRSHRVGCWVTW